MHVAWTCTHITRQSMFLPPTTTNNNEQPHLIMSSAYTDVASQYITQTLVCDCVCNCTIWRAIMPLLLCHNLAGKDSLLYLPLTPNHLVNFELYMFHLHHHPSVSCGTLPIHVHNYPSHTHTA